MKYIAYILIAFLSIMFLSNCEKNGVCKDDELALHRIDYSGNQLRIDGYFFGDVTANSTMPFANIYYFNRDGVFFTSEATDLDKAEGGAIIVDIDNNFSKQSKGLWGVFQVNGNIIEIERWQSRPNGCEVTKYECGDILNDTTFVITRREYRSKAKAEKVETPNSTFYFRPLVQKPDSTNDFVK